MLSAVVNCIENSEAPSEISLQAHVRTLAPCDLAPAAAPPALGNIPWGYGQDRVTAMARDPHWMFVYWEVTDEAIERARAAVGAGDAPCVLRVYDTTYRLFDGTNANWSMDVDIHRPSNNHYVQVNRPGATFQVDIGVRSGDGRLAPIARSGTIEMPRDSVSSDTRTEWMTVTADGAPARVYRHRYRPRPAGAGQPAGPGGDVERIGRSLVGGGWTRLDEWTETHMGGRTVRWIRRVEAGAVRVEVVLGGGRRVIRLEHGERVVFGPWRVTIHGIDARGASRVIDRWSIQYAWLTGAGGERIETVPILRRILQGYRAVRESWASQALQAGASEWQWLGASELELAGASELLFRGASELALLRASELRYLGASEVPFLGASEWRAGGASERGGGSEAWPGETGR